MKKIQYRMEICRSMVGDLSRLAGLRKAEFVFVDPVFPGWAKGFHGEFEYGALQGRLGAPTALLSLGGSLYNFYQVLDHARSANPDLAEICAPFGFGEIMDYRVAYAIFPSTIHSALKQIRKHQARFCFTAYPGSFRINEKKYDNLLREIVDAPGFRCVLATQIVTQNYLEEKIGVPRDRIEFSFGGFFRLPDFSDRDILIDQTDKVVITFCAHRHIPWARDKGLDAFVNIAESVLSAGLRARFIIIGPFQEEIGEIRDRLGEHVLWISYAHNVELLEIYRQSDCFIAPIRAFVESPGRFDGFPVAAAVQAGAAGQLLIMNDPLSQGVGFFEDGVHYLRLPANERDHGDFVIETLRNRSVCRKIAKAGQRRIYELYDPEYQINKRLGMIQRCL